MLAAYPARELFSLRGVLVGMRLVPVLAIAALLAACGSSSDGGASTTSGSSPTAKAPVSSAKKAKVGQVVVDAKGFTLYRFTAEAQGRPVCTGSCVDTWPPATVNSDAGLPDHVATVKRADSAGLQLTYDGHPLYRYSGDQSTADANGDGIGGQWYAVKAGGTASGGSTGGGTTTQESKRSYGY
jgi:predicted lipoprotein with Yx(FWY)xxD motif